MSMGRQDPESGLTPKQEKFCEIYTTMETGHFGSGVKSYAEAYEINLTDKTYNSCKVNASQLLKSQKIIDRINELLEEGGLNDQFIDKQMLFLISQKEDLKAALGGIQEYNKIKQRITKKIEVKTDEPDYSHLSTEEKLELFKLLSKAKNKGVEGE
jgi:hypothetical protein